ncbi:ScbR family autoregulator-binding transcription factor [Sanguibacter antarcticus]|uniref:TetR family transcriptional regulator n=1 Tax=Sanguibacter antarcticus TaxID=372484 RepID=A0A2A9E984_9MICO|nr:ScbR family autoregulator-binding transcription factor [Sanguibacter antarcticus]PFG34792.1 TetR family transcriptional regulator [Sanguibacter antarcticus]
MSRRSDQRAATRAGILQVAAEEFEAHGYVGASLADIAERLGLTKGALYFHYPSKGDIARAIVANYFNSWEPLVTTAEARGNGPLEGIRWLTGEVAVAYRDDIHIRAAVRLVRDRAAIDVEMPTPFVDWIKTSRYFLEKAAEVGEIRSDLDLDRVTLISVAAWFGVQQVSQDLDSRESLQSFTESLWDLLLDGMK